LVLALDAELAALVSAVSAPVLTSKNLCVENFLDIPLSLIRTSSVPAIVVFSVKAEIFIVAIVCIL
jgi:hypothetical protein